MAAVAGRVQGRTNSPARRRIAAGVADPTTSEDVKLALKEMSQGMAARQRQARGLVSSKIAVFLEFEPWNLRDVRDRALVVVAYDTMCRREELVSLLIEDIESAEDGSGTVVNRRSKTDTTGEGTTAYLSPLSMRLVGEWRWPDSFLSRLTRHMLSGDDGKSKLSSHCDDKPGRLGFTGKAAASDGSD
jgi:integrase